MTSSVPASNFLATQTKKPERHWTRLQEQPSELLILYGLQETPSNLEVGSWLVNLP